MEVCILLLEASILNYVIFCGDLFDEALYIFYENTMYNMIVPE